MRKVIHLLLTTLFLLVFAGCATLVTNNLPRGIPFGYVEFYRKGVNPGFQETVYQVFDGKAKNMGNIITKRRRVACRPGQSTFRVNLGTASQDIDVTVVEQHVTSVAITYENLHVIGNTVYFKLWLTEERPVLEEKN